MKLLSFQLKIFTNVSIASNVNQCCPTRRRKSEYKNLGLSWLSTVRLSWPCCIKSLNFLRMVSLMTKEEHSVRTSVATLSNYLSSSFKFSWAPFTLRIFLQIVRSSFVNQYFLLKIMPTNCSQLKELEMVQVLDGKRISTPDSIPCVGLFVTYRTGLILITIGTPSSFRSILFVLCNLTSSRASS